MFGIYADFTKGPYVFEEIKELLTGFEIGVLGMCMHVNVVVVLCVCVCVCVCAHAWVGVCVSVSVSVSVPTSYIYPILPIGYYMKAHLSQLLTTVLFHP